MEAGAGLIHSLLSTLHEWQGRGLRGSQVAHLFGGAGRGRCRVLAQIQALAGNGLESREALDLQWKEDVGVGIFQSVT